MSDLSQPTPTALASDPAASPIPPRQTARGAKAMDLTQGPIAKTLLIFALPTLASNVLQTLSGSINSIFVGHFLGESALAATANANIIMFLMVALFFGFGIASTVLIGQCMGRKDHDGALRATGTVTGLAMIFSVIIAILGWLESDSILRLLATPDEAMQYAHDYLRITFLAIPASMILVTLTMASRGAGDAVTPLRFMILTVVLDIILNPLLIQGIGPFPRMGIAGSATAAAIANIVSLIAFITWCYTRGHVLRLPIDKLSYLIPAGPALRFILLRGVPMGTQMLVISGAGLVMVGLVNREGLDMSAAYAVVLQLWNYVQMPALAIGAAVSAMAAQNIGAGKWDRVGKVTLSGALTNLVMTGLLIMLMLIFDRALLSLFLDTDGGAMELGRHIMLLATWTFLPFGVTMVVLSTLRANGAVIAPLIILAISMFPIRLGLYYALYPSLGSDAIWWSFPLSSLCSLTMALLVYRHGGWRRKGAIINSLEQ
jgi:putative MATE family efflux protein